MPILQRWLREPVAHFFVAGFLLYALALAIRGDDINPQARNVIEVDREALLEFIQYRSNIFDPRIASYLDTLSAAEVQQLADDYVVEELMYREAAALGLDQSDYIIRQRMVDKMGFLLTDLAGAEQRPADAELTEYLQANLPAYRVKPAATFTHVFFDSERHGADNARHRAEQALLRLNEEQKGFNDALAEGDHFPLQRHYVERTVEHVSGHFGPAFGAALLALEADNATWQGPLPSAYGWHLVLLTELTPARDPGLEEVRPLLEQDFLRERSREGLQRMIRNLRDEYDVQINL